MRYTQGEEDWIDAENEIAKLKKTMIKNYVAFYSPGTFVSEVTTKEIPTWDIQLAQQMAKDITERYGAKPYAFQFYTREKGPEDFEPRDTAKSCTYYIGVKVETLEEIRIRNDPRESTLLRNMESNGFDKVVRTVDGWQWSVPLREGDVVLP